MVSAQPQPTPANLEPGSGIKVTIGFLPIKRPISQRIGRAERQNHSKVVGVGAQGFGADYGYARHGVFLTK